MDSIQIHYKTKESDLFKDLIYTLIAVIIFIAILSLIFKSPYEPPMSIAQFAKANPKEFEQTAMGDLMQTGEIATYGPPYNRGASQQSLGFINPEQWMGQATPVNTKQEFVINPLKMTESINPSITYYIQWFQKSSLQTQKMWETNYNNALQKAKIVNGDVVVPNGNYGPVSYMISSLLALGKSGFMARALDANVPGNNSTYTYNFQNRLLFLQGTALTNLATKENMLGSQMGIIKYNAAYPGPWWLTYYNYLYLFPPFAASPAADLLVFGTVFLTFLLLILLPYIPILNRIPYYIPVYKLIWRNYYKNEKSKA